MNSKTYDWVPAVGAPELYPIKILKGRFVSDGGYSPNLPISAFVNMGWGESGGVMAVGPELKPIPDSLDISWLSYAENKYYGGHFLLPKDKIAQIFENGYIDHEENKKVTYYYLTLGLTPKGGITLWAVGAKQQVQIDSFQAQEQKINPNQIKDEERIYLDPNFVQQRYKESASETSISKAKNEGYSPAYWQHALVRYPVKFEDKSNVLYELNATFINAEREHLFGTNLQNDKTQKRALPTVIYLHWLDEKKQMMISELQFDPTEVKELFSKAEGQDITISFDIDKAKYGIKTILSTGKQSIPFQKTKITTEISSS